MLFDLNNGISRRVKSPEKHINTLHTHIHIIIIYTITKHTCRAGDLETGILHGVGICTTGRFVFR